MLYLLHHAADIVALEEKILPLLKGKEFQLISYPKDRFTPEEHDYVLTYLKDEHLKELIPRAAKKKWVVGILPHPKDMHINKAFGLSEKHEKIIAQILKKEEKHQLDLLFCNEVPVFQSVNIGHIFLLTKGEENNFFFEIFRFLKNIKYICSLFYQPLQLSIDNEKVLKTAALGIIVVEHSMNSIISKRLVSETAANDGMFHVFILAPENIFQLINFFIRSLIPFKGPIKKLPSFIGMVKTSNLKIECQSKMDFTIDGEHYTSREINLQVEAESLCLKQASKYITEKGNKEAKKSLKIDQLPTGEKVKELTRGKLPWIPRATTEEFMDLFTVLRDNSKITGSFLIMMILSTVLASFGLFGDSSPVIIGAMILAPIISPIVSFSMGMVRYDLPMLKAGAITIIAGTIVSLAFSAGVSLAIPLQVLTPEIDNRLSPTLLDMGIAVISGIAAAYAHAKEGIAKSLAGVAIAVALVPPLSVAGIGIGWWDWEVFSGAFLLYLTNLSGIILFAGITFLFLGFAPFRTAKMGLVYTFFLVVVVMVPLSLSFKNMKEKAQLTKQLEGSHFRNVILRDVKVRFGKKLMVSVKLVGPESIGSEEMEKIKELMELELGQPIILEVISAIEF